MTDPRGGFGRCVCDTNVLVSLLLRRQSTPALAVARALTGSGKLLASPATLGELDEVLMRPKFDRYVSRAVRAQFLIDLMPVIELVRPEARIRACRDPRDDKFLELAAHGRADTIITGDADLLALHPFHGVAILSPQAFLALPEPAAP